jgi:LysM repeat protein
VVENGFAIINPKQELQKIYSKKIPIIRERVVGHNEIAPIERPDCPGRKFPFDELIKLASDTNKNTATTIKTTAETHPYIVKSGDTMSGIAKRFGLSLGVLAAANPSVVNLDKIRVGQQIVIPTTAPQISTPNIGTPEKSVNEVANEIWRGQGGWGNNPGRRQKLVVYGGAKFADDVQKRVNEIASGK